MENARTFTARLADLLALERAALGEFLVALAAFDAKRLWLELGYASLFDFLHRELGLSKGAAFYRKTAVDLIHRFPEVVEPLRDGRLCLMSVAEVARVLTPENRRDVLPRFFRLSKRDAQALAATLMPQPKPPQREVVTPVRAIAAPALVPIGPEEREEGLVQPVELDRDFDSPALQPLPRRDPLPIAPPAQAPRALAPSTTTEPLTADLSRLHVTVPRRFLAKLEQARAALSHSRPGASTDEILEAGLDLLISRHEKRRGIGTTPRKVAPRSKTDHVPAHVAREVWKRDGGRCQWKLDGGGTCGSTHRLQLDHILPRARGGPSTVENLRVLCGVHNDLAARHVYGDEWMDRFSGPRRAEHAAAP